MKKLTLIIALLLVSCNDEEICGCTKTTYLIESTFNPVTITHVEQSEEFVFCQDEVERKQIGTGNYWYKIECN
jgi:hypothetical protein